MSLFVHDGSHCQSSNIVILSSQLRHCGMSWSVSVIEETSLEIKIVLKEHVTTQPNHEFIQHPAARSCPNS
jgi:hypothetical protein